MTRATANSPKTPKPPETIEFNHPRHLHGWLSLRSSYGFEYEGVKYRNLGSAWFRILYGVTDEKYYLNHVTTGTALKKDSEKFAILLDLLRTLIATHPIVETFLLDTGQAELIYSVSKFANKELQWLGTSPLRDNNYLGRAWMQMRTELQETRNDRRKIA